MADDRRSPVYCFWKILIFLIISYSFVVIIIDLYYNFDIMKVKVKGCLF